MKSTRNQRRLAILTAAVLGFGAVQSACNLVDPVSVAPPDAWEETDSSSADLGFGGEQDDAEENADSAPLEPDSGSPVSDSEVADGSQGGGGTTSGGETDGGSEPTCDDGVKNGDETATDCGGPACPKCGLRKDCGSDADCQSGHCGEREVCVATCGDGIENGDESDVDCGGGDCDACVVGDTCSAKSDCASGWCKDGTCTVRVAGALEEGDPGRWSNGDLGSSCNSYRRPGRPNYRYTSSNGDPGDGIYKIKPPSASSPVKVYCEMQRDGGGWTLVASVADDADATWTWNDRTLFTTDTTTFGSPSKRKSDYKSRAYHELEFEDLLFVHRPSDKWLAYGGAGSGDETIAARLESTGRTCYGDKSRSSNIEPGIPSTAGDVQANGHLCSTDLYLNPKDQRGDAVCDGNEDAFGPAWSSENGGGCPMDDPGSHSSMGPNSDATGTEDGSQGFAHGAGVGQSDDALLMFVR